MTSTHEGELPIAGLPNTAIKCHLFDALGQTALISIGQLCDAGCHAIFTEDDCAIVNTNGIVLSGVRNQDTNGLWILDIDEDSKPNKAFHATNNYGESAPELVAFAHAALWSPAPSTIKTALEKGFLPPFPGLTTKTLNKYTPDSDATIQGHLDKARKNYRSTKTKPKQDPFLNDATTETLADQFPVQPEDGKRSHLCFVATHDIKGAVHSDLTGRFPTASTSGNNYLLIAYSYDDNNILLEPVKNRKADTLLEAYKNIHNVMAAQTDLVDVIGEFMPRIVMMCGDGSRPED